MDGATTSSIATFVIKVARAEGIQYTKLDFLLPRNIKSLQWFKLKESIKRATLQSNPINAKRKNKN